MAELHGLVVGNLEEHSCVIICCRCGHSVDRIVDFIENSMTCIPIMIYYVAKSTCNRCCVRRSPKFSMLTKIAENRGRSRDNGEFLDL